MLNFWFLLEASEVQNKTRFVTRRLFPPYLPICYTFVGLHFTAPKLHMGFDLGANNLCSLFFKVPEFMFPPFPRYSEKNSEKAGEKDGQILQIL